MEYMQIYKELRQKFTIIKKRAFKICKFHCTDTQQSYSNILGFCSFFCVMLPQY